MTNQQPTTSPPPEAPEQPTLPQAETRAVASVPVEAADLAAENTELRAELYMRTAVYDIESRLAKAGARTPNLIAERAKPSFQFDDEGKLTNAEAIVDELRRTYPEQFAVPSIDAAAGRTPRPTLTKEALARMTSAEIQRLDWNEVRAALAS